MERIGILGSGMVAKTLAEGLVAKGYRVMLGSGHPDKLAELNDQHGDALQVGSFADALRFGDLAILAVKGMGAKKVLNEAQASEVASKIIVDATNPISEKPPVDGVLQFFTDINHSLMEDLQGAFPNLKFVKALNSVGSAHMVDPAFGETPTMFICGNDAQAKSTVSDLLANLGWEVSDMGTAVAARAIEPLCMLWCIPGFRENSWNHAFKLLRK